MCALLTTILAALVALVVGLGAGWLPFSTDTIDNEVDKLVRDYIAAWDAGDGDAAVALMAANAKHYDGHTVEEVNR